MSQPNTTLTHTCELFRKGLHEPNVEYMGRFSLCVCVCFFGGKYETRAVRRSSGNRKHADMF